MQIKPFNALLIAPFLLALVGCSDGQRLPNSFEEYQKRMFRVLSIKTDPIQPQVNIDFPAVEQRRVTIPTVTIPLRDFYAINGCELAPLIAQRNTALGKVEYPSRRIVYEAQLRDTLQNCIALIEHDVDESEHNTVKSGLENALTQKRLNFPMTWANLIQNSDNIRLGLSFDQRFVQGDETDGFIETTQALQYLHNIKTGKPITHSEIERHLAHIEQFRLPARLFRTTRYLITGLTHVNALLKDHNSDFICATAHDKKQISIFKNVMSQFFIQELQPIASSTNRYAQVLLPLLTQIVEDKHINSAMKAFIQNEIDIYGTYKQKFAAHVSELQTLLNRCGLQPSPQ